MKKNYKVGDKVVARIAGERKVGVITNIEWDDSKDEYVADLDCGNWCYLYQIVGRA